MREVIQVRLREAGKVFFYESTGMKVRVGKYVIVEAERGVDYGQALTEPELISDRDMDAPLKKVIRVATRADLNQIAQNKYRTKEALNICTKKIPNYKLDMKLIDAEYSFDRSKIIFYFTAAERIDFRDLVKDLARNFKARIEMRQIGVRDEARMLGGFGPCGRPLCCAKFLKDFEPVTIRMAKEQNLPLNPTKISGLCGRLMCCLEYEYETYKELMKTLPREGERITTKNGKGRVLSVNALKRSVLVEIEGGRQIEVSYE